MEFETRCANCGQPVTVDDQNDLVTCPYCEQALGTTGAIALMTRNTEETNGRQAGLFAAFIGSPTKIKAAYGSGSTSTLLKEFREDSISGRVSKLSDYSGKEVHALVIQKKGEAIKLNHFGTGRVEEDGSFEIKLPRFPINSPSYRASHISIVLLDESETLDLENIGRYWELPKTQLSLQLQPSISNKF